MSQEHRMDEDTLAEVERAGARFNAVTAMTVDRAEELNARSDEWRDFGRPPRPLEGIPFAIKDVIDLAGYPTTMGSNVRSDAPVAASAPVVSQLEEAGAIPVAKTNCQEYSYGILGDESAFGRVTNPIDPALCTAGSSSGSAALVAAGVVPLALGTDTAGSVRVPAACQGVLGFKPSYGVVPVEGVFPLSASFDTVGLFAADLGLLTTTFDVIAGTDVPGASAAGADVEGSAARQSGIGGSDCKDSDLSGWTVDFSLFGKEGNRAEDLLASLPNVTATAASGQMLSKLIEEAAPIYDIIRRFEAFDAHKELIADRAEDYQPGVRAKILSGRDISDDDYREQLDALARLRAKAVTVFETADFLLTPAIDGTVIRWDDIDEDSAAKLMRYSRPFNILGWPALTIPVTSADSTAPPQAIRPQQVIQLVGPPGRDRELLNFAARL
jgi:aspartyl-tRNA(Asn)/glutamyl-tRNA(Gln) amidotransferase subunit A